MSFPNNNQPCPPSPVAAAVGIVPYNPEPLNRNGRTSTVAARKNRQNESIPSNTMTCLQVKAIEDSIGCSSNERITICTSCGSFDLEKFGVKKLRHLKDNSPLTGVIIPRHFRCTTLWIATGKSVTSLSSSLVTPSLCCHHCLGPQPLFRNQIIPPLTSNGHSTASPLRSPNTLKPLSSPSIGNQESNNKQYKNLSNKTNSKKKTNKKETTFLPPD